MNGVPVGLNSTVTEGHSSEIGLRLRGTIRPRLFYGITGGWLGASLGDSLARTAVVNSSQLDRAHRVSLGFGLGYILNRNTVFTFDTAAGTSYASAARTEDANGNLLQNGIANGHLLSAHVAVQRNVWRRVFVSASFLNIWYDQRQHVEAYPDQFGSLSVVQDAFFPVSPQAYQFAPRFSDLGVGWRWSSAFLAEYLFTYYYAITPPVHSLMLRYTFSRRTAN